jgi:hypothetical protein
MEVEVMKVETTSLVRCGASRRRVLFSDETARAMHGADDRTRAGIWQSASEWAEWASRLVHRTPRSGDPALPAPGEIEVR